METTHGDRVPSAPSEHGTPSPTDTERRVRLAGAIAGGAVALAVAAAVAATLIERSTAPLAPRGAHAASVPAAVLAVPAEPAGAAAATPRVDARHLPAASDGIHQPWECNDEKPC